jgi:signal transduction histidine kinase
VSSEGSATFALTVEGETRELHPIVRDEVYRITREALHNAFNHALAKHIEAEITYGEQLFRCEFGMMGRASPRHCLKRAG